ncbi:MAG: aminotransferase class V-fold PLP-dependent enzyme [Chitinivibrionales bacterium]|nr:aminotransferase class V-fold PLP-dependent enzyme [Chitinivibrionales bacterium]
MNYVPSHKRRSRFLVFGSPLVTEKEIVAVENVMRSCWLGTGPRVEQFEQAFRDYIGCKHAIALNSCTASLHLAMLASGVGPGDEVITTPLTFCATANAIIHTGARPVFVDVDADTQNIDPQRIEAAISPKTKALLPVHFAGRPCDMDALGALAHKHRLLLIEDAAHAVEAVYKGRRIGTVGDMTCFSFYVTKNLFTGEGGMVTTDDEDLAARIKMYGLHGMTKDAWARYSDEGFKHYQVVFPGYKYNMMDLQAAMGLEQLPVLEAYRQRRCEIWDFYTQEFAGLPVQTPCTPQTDTVHARHLYTILLDLNALSRTRDEFMDALCAENIGTGVHYISLHLHPYYAREFNLAASDFPNASHISQRTLSLPLSAKLTDEDCEDVVRAVKRVAAYCAK